MYAKIGLQGGNWMTDSHFPKEWGKPEDWATEVDHRTGEVIIYTGFYPEDGELEVCDCTSGREHVHIGDSDDL
jgi:hypothetical protein